jgi:hypothetical protein
MMVFVIHHVLTNKHINYIKVRMLARRRVVCSHNIERQLQHSIACNAVHAASGVVDAGLYL